MSLPNFYANLTNLKQLSTEILDYLYSGNTVNWYIQNFLVVPSSNTYDPMESAIVAARAAQTLSTPRVLLANADGRVIYDSSRSSPDLNSYTNYSTSTVTADIGASTVTFPVSGLIGENHSGRPEILQATLSSAGYGSAIRYSDTTSTQTIYWATRLGPSVESPSGVLRVSVNLLV